MPDRIRTAVENIRRHADSIRSGRAVNIDSQQMFEFNTWLSNRWTRIKDLQD